MANHVTSRIYIVEGNEKADAALKAYSDKIQALVEKGRNDDNRWYTPSAYELWDDTLATVECSDWQGNIDKIGAKWCHVFDWSDDEIAFESAWGYPEGALLRIAQSVMAADPEAILAVSYEDEMPNFIGCLVYADGNEVDSLSIDSEEYEDYDLKFWWDEEEEGEEEPEDFEPTWEEAHNVIDQSITDMVENIKANREDTVEEVE
jgi:hypothetical protein